MTIFPVMRIARSALGIVLILPFLLLPTAAEEQRRVAILPFKIYAQENLSYLSKALNEMLAARLGAEGKVSVVPEAEVEKALRDYPAPEAVRELGRSLKADWLIRGSLTKVGEQMSIDAELTELNQMKAEQLFVQGQGMDSIIPKVTELGKILHARMVGGKVSLSVEQASRPPAGPAAEARVLTRPVLWQSPVIPQEIKGMAAADVDGDGKTEILVLHQDRITIYRHTEKGVVPVGKIGGSSRYNFIHLSLADINGNGIPEIFVSGLEGEAPRSFVLEFHKGSAEKIAPDMDRYLRALSWPGKGNLLLAQKEGPTGEDSGPMEQFVWEKGRYVSRGVVPLPWRAGIYDFTPLGPDDKGVEQFLILNRDLRPHLVSAQGQVSWHLKESYAQSRNQFERVKTNMGPGFEFPNLIYIPLRLVAVPLGSSPGVRIILPKNDVSAFGFVAGQRRVLDGEVHTFVWSSQGLAEAWKISGLPGYVADILVGDINGDGKEELVVAVVIPGTLGMGSREGRLLAYELPGAPAP